MGGDFPINDLFGITLLLVASAFFSSAETALTSLSEARIRQMQAERPATAKAFQRWLDHPGSILATLLVGNNIVNVAVSVLMARVANRYLASWADAIAVGLATLLLLGFGEVAPKTVAKRFAPSWAPRIVRLVCLLDRVLRPLSFAFSSLGRAAARTAGAAGLQSEPSVTKDEIEHMIDLGQREGVLGEDRGDMLRSVLEFQDTVVKEVMVPRTEMVAVSITASLSEILALLHNSRHSRIPVFRDRLDNIVGLLYAKDLLSHVGCGPSGDRFNWTDHVRPNPVYVPETQKLSALLREMQTRKVHLAVVVDEFGGTSGIVTLEDVLEEIVGEIQDEDDTEEPLIEERNPGFWCADARVPLWDLGQRLGVEFPDPGDFETLGGFVTHLAGRLPSRGAQVRWQDYLFTVREADARSVRKVEVRRQPKPSVPPDGPPPESSPGTPPSAETS